MASEGNKSGNPQWTPELARELGRKGGEARAESLRRKKEMTPEERAREVIMLKQERLVSELLDAALGQGDFAQLDLKTRVSATVKALEWSIGRPASAPKGQGRKPEEPEEESFGINIFTQEPA